MARAKGKESRQSSPAGKVRSGLSATALLLIGGCVGLTLGSLLDGPRVFLRHLLEPSESAEIAGGPLPVAPAELTEYRALQQTGARPKPRPAPPPPVAAPEPRPPQSTAAQAPAPRSRPAQVATPPTEPEVKARQLIDEMAAKRAAARDNQAKPRPEPPREGSKVVQIAAYKDIRSAEALVRRLRRGGFDSYVSRTRPEGEERFRVRVSPSGGSDIETLATQLRERGFSIWVTTE
jgi:cell division septation protein DedD